MAHTRFRQTVDGIPVWEGEVIVHLKADGTLSSITDDLKEAVHVNTTPSFSVREVAKLALRSYKGRRKTNG